MEKENKEKIELKKINEFTWEIPKKYPINIRYLNN